MPVSFLKYVGIDFSGSQGEWNPNTRTSNVWIAEVEERDTVLNLINLRQVQQLPGQSRPFGRLAVWLADQNCSAVAIDAPFSIPWWFFGQGFTSHPELMAYINNLPLGNARDFPTGGEFVAAIATAIAYPFTKPLRVTECYWRGRGVNIRSTVWNGPRGGAPFTSACIKLLAATNLPLWPWVTHGNSLLVEAFPAAQLRYWGLPHIQYNGAANGANRNTIVDYLTTHRGLLANNNDFLIEMRNNADALDAVLCAYAARAVIQNNTLGVALPSFDAWRLEGWIAVHK